ncbi:MAG: hypothetical protein Q9227_004839 [Pyrenula ochraceoflavens]
MESIKRLRLDPWAFKWEDRAKLFNTALYHTKLEHGRNRSSCQLHIQSLREVEHPYDILVRICEDNRARPASRSMLNGQSGLTGTIEYAVNCLSEDLATNVAHTFVTALQSLTSNPDQLIRDLSLISSRDRKRIEEWNSAAPEKVLSCIHHVITEKARQSPSQCAIESWDGKLSYADLENLSSSLAAHLRHLGARRGSKIPISFDKSKLAVVAMLAVLKAGAAFVAIDPSHPKDRRERILGEVAASLIVSDQPNAASFHGHVEQVVCLSDHFQWHFAGEELGNTGNLCPQDIACILYTSGSTGRPKGIVLPHSALCTMVKTHAEALHVRAESRVFQYAAYTFDVSIMDIFTTLYCGGCLCIPSEQERKMDISGAMNRLKANWADVTPTVASLLSPDEVPRLQTLVLAGEEVSQDLVFQWAERVRLINCYGPVESAACTAYNFPSRYTSAKIIGRAMAGARCWITDSVDHNHLVPIGSVGELLVEGNTLADGYLNNPNASKSVFIKGPKWCEGAGNRRFYKTGDLVYYNLDSTISFIGRKDFQVKIRGQRVELAEIEHCLSSSGLIANGVVSFPERGTFAKKLVSVLQLKSEGLAARNEELRLSQVNTTKSQRVELIHHLAQRLPAYMLPQAWLFVESLPLTPSAKIDRKKISLWLESDESSFSAQFHHTVLEKDLPMLPSDDKLAFDIGTLAADIISDGKAEILEALRGRNFPLLETGIDSIQVMTLATRLHQQFGVRVGVEKLTHSGFTVQDLVEEVRGNDSSSAETIVAEVDLLREVDLFRTEMSQWPSDVKPYIAKSSSSETVLLTGATGFLGIHILKQLLKSPHIVKIIALVRAVNEDEASRRVVKSAQRAGWWHHKFFSKLECWTGDLASDRLGLTDSQWKSLSGHGSVTISSIIHNGAVVRWNTDFESLATENVGSTKELLRAIGRCLHRVNFIYVSGGQKNLFQSEDDDLDHINQALASNGYSQTKLLSEIMVKDFARSSHGRSHHVSVVKPGYIIGNAEDGIANTDDYIWRFAAGALDTRGYDMHDAESWLFISDVDRVASAILHDTIQSQELRQSVATILDGITVKDFWHIFNQCGYPLKPMHRDPWLKSLKKIVEAQGPKHLLWPVLYMIEDGTEGISSRQKQKPDNTQSNSTRVKAAVTSNIRYLQRIGYLPEPEPLAIADEKKRQPVHQAKAQHCPSATQWNHTWTVKRSGDLSRVVCRALFRLLCASPAVLALHIHRRIWNW